MLVLNVTKLIEIFIVCDDFCDELSLYLQKFSLPDPHHKQTDRKMCASEMMAIIIFYHLSGFKSFKWYYMFVVQRYLTDYFPTAFSYSRFVQLQKELHLLLSIFLIGLRLAPPTEANYIDATKIVVTHNKRIKKHKVFKGTAKRGKSSTGWFFGFKIHLVINHLGQIVFVKLTSGNVADNNKELLSNLADKVNGFLYGDKGYLSSITEELKEKGLHLITKVRANMKNKKAEKHTVLPEQKYYLKHRGLIETVFDILKNICDIEHSRHRSITGLVINVIAALIAYTFMEKQPTIPSFPKKITKEELIALPIRIC